MYGNKKVFHRKYAPWLANFEAELKVFDRGSERRPSDDYCLRWLAAATG
jgi:hypothetical protein